MTNSEKICNELGIKFFYKDFVYQNLKYKNSKNYKVELCDGLFEYCENYIALQVKERDSASINFNDESWLKNIVYTKAVQQILTTLNAIKNDEIIVKDCYQQNVILNKSYGVFPLIVFDNSNIKNYKRVLSVNGILINILKLNDYKDMMNIIIQPYEILEYLSLRIQIFNDRKLPDIVFWDNENSTMIAKIDDEKSFIEVFKMSKNEADISKEIPALRILKIIENFRNSQQKANPNYKDILRILQMINPDCAIGFIERFDYAIKKCESDEFDITKTVQLLKDNKKIDLTFCSIGKTLIKKTYYQVICDAKQLQHDSDLVILIVFTMDSKGILIDWVYYDKPKNPDTEIKEYFENIGMYDGTIDLQTFIKICKMNPSLNETNN